jgi:hypothetical protein
VILKLVWVKLNNFEFEAEKFETRTMPTPDMKGKEIIYWIMIKIQDKRLATDLGRFMDGAPKFIDLRVPSALIAAKTEVETFRKLPPKGLPSTDVQPGRQTKIGGVLSEEQADEVSENNYLWRFEIVLRRTLPSSSEKQTQSPYG